MLDSLLFPSAVAVIGASEEIRRPGGQVLHGLTQYGYAGQVYPVNPKRDAIKNLLCYPNVREIKAPCDLAILAIPASEVPSTIEQCGSVGIRNAVVLSAGFREIGERGAQLQSQLDEAIARSGVRVVGPNCVGILNLRARLFAGFGSGFRNPEWRGGPVAMISQSGGFAYSIVSFCQEQGVGIDYMVSTGNESDLTALDFIEHMLEQEEVRLVAVYIEGVKDGRRLRALGRRALEVDKPIAIWKVGNTNIGRQAALSHTANLTEDYDFYQDAFREGGFIEVREVYDLIDAAKAFRSHRRPAGRRLAVVTTSGGAGVLIADRCEEANLTLPPLSEDTSSQLRAVMPDFASVGNPVDLTATLAQNEPKFREATELVVADTGVDLVILRSYPGKDAETWAKNLMVFSESQTKPLLVSLSGTQTQAAAWAPMLDEAGIACYEAPSRAVAAALMLCDFTEKKQRFQLLKPTRITSHHEISISDGHVFTEEEAKRLIEIYGISTPRRDVLPLGKDIAVPDIFNFPVAVKIVSPDIIHKTEVSGVCLSVQRDDLLRVIRKMQEDVREKAPHAQLQGFLVEEMVSGVEILVGALSNPTFGPLVVVGYGGTSTELFRDVVRRYAPIEMEEARQMIMELKCAPLLLGFRGNVKKDVDALADVITKVSQLIADHQDVISEIEINPVIVSDEGFGAIAVDAVIRLSKA